MHMYKSRKKEFILALLVASLPLIFVIIALSLARLNEERYNQVQLQPWTRAELCKQSKLKRERKSFWVFSKVNQKQKEREIFLLLLQIKKEQRRTGKFFEKMKANTMDDTMERGEGYAL